MTRVLITGASGGLAEIVADVLQKKYELIGVDPRPMPEGREFPGKFYQIDYRQRKIMPWNSINLTSGPKFSKSRT